jgi:hypothetical protein
VYRGLSRRSSRRITRKDAWFDWAKDRIIAFPSTENRIKQRAAIREVKQDVCAVQDKIIRDSILIASWYQVHAWPALRRTGCIRANDNHFSRPRIVGFYKLYNRKVRPTVWPIWLASPIRDVFIKNICLPPLLIDFVIARLGLSSLNCFIWLFVLGNAIMRSFAQSNKASFLVILRLDRPLYTIWSCWTHATRSLIQSNNVFRTLNYSTKSFGG